MSITSASLSCATRPARSGGSSAGAGVAARPSGGGVQKTFAAGAGQVESKGARVKRAKPLAVGDRLRIRRGPFEYLVVVRALAEHRAPPAAAAALYDEDAEGRRRRERLAEQLRVAPSLRYEGKGRPTKKDRREIERLRGD